MAKKSFGRIYMKQSCNSKLFPYMSLWNKTWSWKMMQSKYSKKTGSEEMVLSSDQFCPRLVLFLLIQPSLNKIEQDWSQGAWARCSKGRYSVAAGKDGAFHVLPIAWQNQIGWMSQWGKVPFQSAEDTLHLVHMCSHTEIQARMRKWETTKNSLMQHHYGVLGWQPKEIFQVSMAHKGIYEHINHRSWGWARPLED